MTEKKYQDFEMDNPITGENTINYFLPQLKNTQCNNKNKSLCIYLIDFH